MALAVFDALDAGGVQAVVGTDRSGGQVVRHREVWEAVAAGLSGRRGPLTDRVGEFSL